jgi:putative FmdB family regulatory protein
MPTYEYICENCRHKFEQFQTITAKALRKCPQCGKNKLKRLLGCGSGVIFKGSGFYQTDYRSESYKKAAKDEKSATTPSPVKTETKTETKTAKKDKSTPGGESRQSKKV